MSKSTPGTGLDGPTPVGGVIAPLPPLAVEPAAAVAAPNAVAPAAPVAALGALTAVDGARLLARVTAAGGVCRPSDVAEAALAACLDPALPTGLRAEVRDALAELAAEDPELVRLADELAHSVGAARDVAPATKNATPPRPMPPGRGGGR